MNNQYVGLLNISESRDEMEVATDLQSVTDFKK